MDKTKSFLMLIVIALLAVGCKTPDDGGIPPESTDETPPITVEPTTEPVPTDLPAPEEAGTDEIEASEEQADASALRFPLFQIADGSSILLTPYDIRFFSSGDLTDLQSAYAEAMEPQGCVVATDIGADGSIGDGYLCQATEEGDRAHFAIFFAFEPDEFREVHIRFDTPEAPPFDFPVPDSADVINEYDTEIAFITASDTFDITAYLDTIGAQNCRKENEVGNPNGGIHASFMCLDESGSPASSLGVSISNSEDGAEVSVSVRVEALSPSYTLTAFPDGAGDFVFTKNGMLEFSTKTSLEDVYAFYTADSTSFSRADCSRVGEASGEAATSMQFLCTDYYNAAYTYDYWITVVISKADNGATITMTFSEG